MAEFNVRPQEQPTGSYVGMSQGIRADRNTSLGTLFSGLAETLESTVQDADRVVQENIRDDIYEQVDAIQGEFGVDDATLFEEDAPEREPLPSQLAEAGENLDRLKAAYEQGALRESHYYARLNSMVRQLRSRYPGYRDQIDSMVSSVTGTRPANALRSALMREFADGVGAEQQRMNSLITNMSNNGYLPPDFFDRQNSSTPYTYSELLYINNTENAYNSNIQRLNAQANLKASQGTLTRQEAEGTFITQANTAVDNALFRMETSVGLTYNQISQQVTQFNEALSRGDQISQQSVAQLAAGLGEVRRQLSLSLHELATTPFGDTGESFSSIIADRNKVDNAIALAMQPIVLLEEAITNENFGVANAMMAQLEARKTDAGVALTNAVPAMDMIAASNEMWGTDITSLVISLSPPLHHEITEALRTGFAAQAVTGNGSVANDLRIATQADTQVAGAGRELTSSLMDTWVAMSEEIGKDQVPAEMLGNYVRYMFGDQWETVAQEMANNETRMQYWSRVSSPQVTQNMLRMRDQGFTEEWDLYQSWVTQGFMQLFRDNIADLNRVNSQSIPAVGVYGSIRWDSRTKQFVGLTNSSGNYPLFSNGSVQFGGSVRNDPQNINRAIAVITPILEANGMNVEQELIGLLAEMGYNPDQEREPTFEQQLGDALMNSLGLIINPAGTEPSDDEPEIQGLGTFMESPGVAQ